MQGDGRSRRRARAAAASWRPCLPGRQASLRRRRGRERRVGCRARPAPLLKVGLLLRRRRGRGADAEAGRRRRDDRGRGRGATIVASCEPIPATNEPGDDPPHADARKRYEEIGDEVIVTGEHPNIDAPEPVVFEFVAGQLGHREPEGEQAGRLRPRPLTEGQEPRLLAAGGDGRVGRRGRAARIPRTCRPPSTTLSSTSPCATPDSNTAPAVSFALANGSGSRSSRTSRSARRL
jgi:hypothetical protein